MNNKNIAEISSLLESLIPERKKRKHCLLIFLEAINHANSCGSNKWGVQCVNEEEKVRLLVGSFIVLTIGKGRLWFALDEESLKTKEDTLLFLENSEHWQWDKDDYPTYKKVLSRNGYYIPSRPSRFVGRHSELWHKIKDLHFKFIDKVASRYNWLLITSQHKHQPALLLYLRQELKQFVPEPDYNQNTNLPKKVIGTSESLSQDELIDFGQLSSLSTIEKMVVSKELEASNEPLFEPTGVLDAREKVIGSIVRRRGQPEFRKNLLKVYIGRCAITGTDAEQALEAAHILPYKGKTTNHLSNGLLLRADIHTLFDLGLIAIDTQTMTVIVAPKLANTSYKELSGKPLFLPADNKHRPSKGALNLHRQAAGL